MVYVRVPFSLADFFFKSSNFGENKWHSTDAEWLARSMHVEPFEEIEDA